jgi:hypothetical protein
MMDSEVYFNTEDNTEEDILEQVWGFGHNFVQHNKKQISDDLLVQEGH